MWGAGETGSRSLCKAEFWVRIPSSLPYIIMKPYFYKAKIISVYDGDTVTAIIDLGFQITNKIKIRLDGINAPEIRGKQRPEGLKSRDYLRSLILDKDVIIQTLRDKKGKYGRYIGIIHLKDENVNELLVESGYAEKKEY